MNKWEKELARLELQGEREVLEQMRRHYAVALSRVNAKIEELAYRDDLPGIRQRRYQEMLAEEIGGIMDDLGSGCYGTLGEYLEQCYEQGFVGTLYNLQKQGVPLAFPIDQRSMARAVTMTAGDVKLSKRVYGNVGKLQEQVIAEITRGFADGSHATKVAQRIAEETDIADSIKRNVQGRGSQAFRRSMTIARTEKGRVKATSTLEAMYKAKEAGADIVKQWDSTMDSRTRKDHVKADGQIRELDEDFEVGGCLGPSPHLMGAAAQDINCRCVCLQRSRSALEWDEPSQKWDGVNQCYVDLSDAENYREFRTAWQIKSTEADIDKLTKSMARYSKQAADLESRSYEGIWRDAVTVRDYAGKKGAIPKKRDYFNVHMSEDEVKFTALLSLLDEFERDGRKYERVEGKRRQASTDLKAKQRELAKLRGEEIADNPYSDDRKDAALWFTDKNGGFKAADKYFDPPALKVHASASAQERDGFYTYTQGSGGHNRPLAGFRKPWRDYGSGWEEKFLVGPKQVWIDYEGKGSQIRGLTTLVEKSTYDEDVWLQSGQGFGTVEGFLGIKYDTLEHMSDADMQQFVGHRGVIFNFLSTAVNKGGGAMFNEKPVKLNIYAPKGSQMLYASDKGAYGKKENEMILQRGGTYRITKMYWGLDATDRNRRKLFVDMEIRVEEGYDLFQQDPSEWKGPKDNYKS